MNILFPISRIAFLLYLFYELSSFRSLLKYYLFSDNFSFPIMLIIPPSVSPLYNLVYVPHDTVNDLFACLCRYIAVLTVRSRGFTNGYLKPSIRYHKHCLSIIVLQMTKITLLGIFMKINIMSKRSGSLECRPTIKSINIAPCQLGFSW